MKPIKNIMELSEAEQIAVSRTLKCYFPWLGTEEEISSAADQVEELCALYEALPQCEEPGATFDQASGEWKISRDEE